MLQSSRCCNTTLQSLQDIARLPWFRKSLAVACDTRCENAAVPADSSSRDLRRVTSWRGSLRLAIEIISLG
ncbi:hypothetical protein PUN28_010856 [Cardiocondyla obscurior]|uniref:Uncharacterized protein n=1 Tax=Cardiocondyla obscurior TaxID=286306 RepID=A0AAW2FNB6_9HYME